MVEQEAVERPEWSHNSYTVLRVGAGWRGAQECSNWDERSRKSHPHLVGRAASVWAELGDIRLRGVGSWGQMFEPANPPVMRQGCRPLRPPEDALPVRRDAGMSTILLVQWRGGEGSCLRLR